ncbi:oxygenase MpaB family protein [Micrococcus endophyticus]|uniref:oxygenase MpaB family protein n=1 Tax=Micrococcus endophyticus TaxID=455343 RepID=UPI0034CDBC4E
MPDAHPRPHPPASTPTRRGPARRSGPTSAAGLAREAAILAGAGAAILLQVAHRPVGAGVAAHSRFTEDPMHRLRHTLAYVYAATLPEAADARDAVVGRVRAAHRPVRGVDRGGRPYDAADPDAQLWVAATLYWAGEQVRRRLWGTLDAEDAERLYRGYAPLATSLEVPASAWPADRAAFAAYWDARIAALEVTDDARSVAADLFSGRGVPAPLRAALPLARFVTAGMLPARVRTGLGWSWSGRDSVREARLWALARTLYLPLPAAVRGVVVRWILRGPHGIPGPGAPAS